MAKKTVLMLSVISLILLVALVGFIIYHFTTTSEAMINSKYRETISGIKLTGEQYKIADAKILVIDSTPVKGKRYTCDDYAIAKGYKNFFYLTGEQTNYGLTWITRVYYQNTKTLTGQALIICDTDELGRVQVIDGFMVGIILEAGNGNQQYSFSANPPEGYNLPIGTMPTKY